MNISIIGCGWVGMPLAEHLIKLNYSVTGSTTDSQKRKDLINQQITPCLLKIDSNNISYDNTDIFKSPILIIMLPFKRSFEDPFYYVNQIKLYLIEL